MTPEQILAFATPIAVIIAAIIQQVSALRAKAAVAEVKDKVVEVKDTVHATTAVTEQKLASIEKTGEKVHILTNSAMGAALRVAAIAQRRIALSTHLPEDLEAADLADKMLKEHDARQSVVNGKHA